MMTTRRWWPLLLAITLVGGCLDAGDFVYGESWEGRPLELVSDSVGVYPDTSVLEDPNNPFALAPPSDDDRWVIESTAGDVVAFYSWATLVATRPTGENQYYTGLKLRAIYETGQASQEDLASVRELSIAAFQAVLDHFPDSVTYDATGQFAYNLATPSYKAIIDLGGTVQGDWILVTTADGGERAVQP